MPIGILGSLAICTVLYILFGYVLTGVGRWQEFLTVGKEASVAYTIQHHMPGYGWLATLVTIAILFGFSSVILVMLLGQSRVFYSMANDGLLPKLFSAFIRASGRLTRATSFCSSLPERSRDCCPATSRAT